MTRMASLLLVLAALLLAAAFSVRGAEVPNDACEAATARVRELAPKITALTPLVSDDPGPVNVFSIPHEVTQRQVGHLGNDEQISITTVRWHVGRVIVVQTFPAKFDAPPTFRCVGAAMRGQSRERMRPPEVYPARTK